MNTVLREEIGYQKLINQILITNNLGTMNTIYVNLKKAEILETELTKKIGSIVPNSNSKNRILFTISEENALGVLKNRLSYSASDMHSSLRSSNKALKIFSKGFQFNSHKAEETEKTEEKKNNEKEENKQIDLGKTFSNLLNSLLGQANSALKDLKKLGTGKENEDNPNRDTSEDYSSSGEKTTSTDPISQFTTLFSDMFNKIKNTDPDVVEGKIKDGTKVVGKFIGALFGGFLQGAKNGLVEGYNSPNNEGSKDKIDEGKSNKAAGVENLKGGYDLGEFKMKKLGVNIAPWTMHSAKVLKKYFPLNEHLAVVELNRLMVQDPKKAARVIDQVYNGENGGVELKGVAADLKHFFEKLNVLQEAENIESMFLKGFKKNLDHVCGQFLKLAKGD